MHEIVVNHVLNYMLYIKKIFRGYLIDTPDIYFFTAIIIPSVTVVDKYALSLSGKHCLKPL